MVEEGIFSKGVERILTLFYAREKKIQRWLLILVFVGFILRLIAALHLNTLADDMLYASQSAGILNSNILSTHSNPPLSFYLTDLAYKIIGYTTFASRLFQLIAGTLLIIVVFLITKKLFNERVALAAAFFATFSNFMVRMTFNEQSLIVFFFSFFAVYLGMLYLDSKNKNWLVFSAILFGMALLTKYNAPFIILSFLIYGIYFLKINKEKILNKSRIKHVILFAVIILVFAMPFIAFNYFIYKERGIVDVYFSRLLPVEKAQNLYQSLAGQDSSFFSNLFKPAVYNNYNLVLKSDLLLGLFAIAGIIIMARQKIKLPLAFLIIFLLIPFILQSGGSNLQKHFLFMHVIFSIAAGYSLEKMTGKIDNKKINIAVIAIIAILSIVNLGTAYGTPTHYFHSSENAQLKSYINQNVGDNDLILLDPRIYSAKGFWLATDNHFLLLSEFPAFYDYQTNITPEQNTPTDIYIVECVIDDCGWGWVHTNQELNASSEAILNTFRENAGEVKSIESYDYTGNELVKVKEKKVKYMVYKMTLMLNPELVKYTNRVHQFYFTPYLYENMEQYVYSYETRGMERLLEKISLGIIYLSIILAILSFLAVFFLL